MAHWLACVLTRRHEYTMWCENGQMFLRCTSCGRRSQGWQVAGTTASHETTTTAPASPARRAPSATTRLSIAK